MIFRGESVKSGPIARTPVRSSSFSPTIVKKKDPDETVLENQISLLKSQDSQLSELSSIIQKHKILGEEIGTEIGKIFQRIYLMFCRGPKQNVG
jgi:hypothetical protein